MKNYDKGISEDIKNAAGEAVAVQTGHIGFEQSPHGEPSTCLSPRTPPAKRGRAAQSKVYAAQLKWLPAYEKSLGSFWKPGLTATDVMKARAKKMDGKGKAWPSLAWP